VLVLSKALILTKVLVAGLRDGKRSSTWLLGDSVIVSGEVKVFSVLDPSVSEMEWKETRKLVKEAIGILVNHNSFPLRASTPIPSMQISPKMRLMSSIVSLTLIRFHPIEFHCD
jgi:hypothetical protein